MKTPPKVGTKLEKRFQVDSKYVVDFSEQGMPPILATPWLIWFLEHAAYDLMQPLLDAGETSVGVQIEIEHLSPTPAGEEVVCSARVVHSDGPVVSFQIEAHDRHDLIARGVHKRRVINAERFSRLVHKKSR